MVFGSVAAQKKKEEKQRDERKLTLAMDRFLFLTHVSYPTVINVHMILSG